MNVILITGFLLIVLTSFFSYMGVPLDSSFIYAVVCVLGLYCGGFKPEVSNSSRSHSNTGKIREESNSYLRENSIRKFRVDYFLREYSNSVTEYVYGANLAEVQTRFKVDPRVRRLLKVVEIRE